MSLEQCVVVPVSMFGAMFFRALGAARSGFLQLQDTLRRVVLGQWLLVEGIFNFFFLNWAFRGIMSVLWAVSALVLAIPN